MFHLILGLPSGIAQEVRRATAKLASSCPDRQFVGELGSYARVSVFISFRFRVRLYISEWLCGPGACVRAATGAAPTLCATLIDWLLMLALRML